MADKNETEPTEQPEKESRWKKGLHLEPLHLGALPEPEPLAEPEHLHPERLHLEHVGGDEEEEEEEED